MYHELVAPVVEHRYYSARAKSARHGHVLHIQYSGVITENGAVSLCQSLLPERVGVAASLERHDKALILLSPALEGRRDIWPNWFPPSAVIVREDQYERSKLVCRKLAALGIIRAVFLPHQTEWATAFVASIAGPPC